VPVVGVSTFNAAYVDEVNANFAALAAAINQTQSYDNSAATGTTVYTLPPGVAGLRNGYAVIVAYQVDVQAPTNVTIYVGELASSAGGKVSSSAVGSSIVLRCISSTIWVAEAITGSWTPS